MLRRCLLLMPALLLAACGGMTPREPVTAAKVCTPEQGLEMAKGLVAAGRWSEAAAVLEQAERSFPGDPAIEEDLAGVRAQWRRERRAIDDRILVGDAEHARDKVALLDRLALGEPEDIMNASRRTYWHEVLKGMVDELTACGEFNIAADPQLARRCFEVASGLPTTPEIEGRLARIEEQLKASESLASEKRRLIDEKQRQAKAKKLLDGAKAAIEARDYRRALDSLDKVSTVQPENREVAGLKEEAWSVVGPQVEALVKLGDHLYLNEQLDAAVATWQAALSLKPGDEDIAARIERAKTVLSRLDTLRRQQNPTPGAE